MKKKENRFLKDLSPWIEIVFNSDSTLEGFRSMLPRMMNDRKKAIGNFVYVGMVGKDYPGV